MKRVAVHNQRDTFIVAVGEENLTMRCVRCHRDRVRAEFVYLHEAIRNAFETHTNIYYAQWLRRFSTTRNQ